MNYYNENGPSAAAWLRELIHRGHIPFGFVDQRSIVDVRPEELARWTQCHFFAGIGGWSEALRLAGWPEDRPVWTGSCPCQPFSSAGQRKGVADKRHLWPEFHRLIAQYKPPVVFGEQVASKDGLAWLDGVFADLEVSDYACAAADLCAAGASPEVAGWIEIDGDRIPVNAGPPHIRQRLYWVALANGRKPRDRKLQSGGEHRQQQADGGIGGMEHSKGVGLLGRPDDGDEGRREQAFGSGSETGGLVQPDRTRRNTGQPSSEATRQRSAVEPASPTGGMEHSEGDGREQRWTESSWRGVTSGCWSDFRVVHCTDGKTRRFEPRSFPLAHGISGRMGLLRGYGNGIVPPLAAEFIEATEEAHLYSSLI